MPKAIFNEFLHVTENGVNSNTDRSGKSLYCTLLTCFLLTGIHTPLR